MELTVPTREAGRVVFMLGRAMRLEVVRDPSVDHDALGETLLAAPLGRVNRAL
jgi:hypothetical protein